MKRYEVRKQNYSWEVIPVDGPALAVYESGREQLAKDECKRLNNMPYLIKVTGLGRTMKNVRFESWQRIYDARVNAEGVVVTLHRVTQQAGGHAVGGSIDKYTSISRNHPNFEGLAMVAATLADQATKEPA